MIDIRVTQLRDVIQMRKNLLIFTHDYPDPDSIVAAEILRVLCGYWGVNSKIVYGGKLDRPENVSMVEKLGFKIYPLEGIPSKDFSSIALVDSQPNFGNHSIPEGVVTSIVFDHHRKGICLEEQLDSQEEDLDKFIHLDEEVSAVCTILMEYLLQVNTSLITKELATGVCYAICTETMDFSRKFSNRDEELYREMCLHCDPILLSKIRSTQIDLDFYRVFAEFIRNLQNDGGCLTTHCFEVTQAYYIPYVADLLSRTDNCRHVFVAAAVFGDKKIRVSARSMFSEVSSFHLGDTIKNVLEGVGVGGGHADIAAGFFYGDQKVLQGIFSRFREMVSNSGS